MQIEQKILERAKHFAEGRGKLSAALRYLERKGILHFGIERVSCAGRNMRYVNFGETYDMTICKEGGEFFLSSWGAWYESAENEHCEESGEISCGYCGEFTESAEIWSETICAHCGHNVSTGEIPQTVENE